MVNKISVPVETRPLDLYYVDVKDTYSTQKAYPVIPASDIPPDPSLNKKNLNLTILDFYAGDLPGEDDWDATMWKAVCAIVPHFRQKANEAMRHNEAFLKLRVAYWKERFDQQTNRPSLDDGPYFADQAFQFVVEDSARAGGFSDRRIFESIRIREALVLHLELQEIDEFEEDVAPYADVLKGTGLDAALQLSPQFASIVPIASGIIRNIARLNKSDTVWDQEFTITTTAGAIGQSKLREGIYVAVETAPESRMPPGSRKPRIARGSQVSETYAEIPLTFKNRRLLCPGENDTLKLWPGSYLVFTVNRTPVDVTASTFAPVFDKHHNELSPAFLTDFRAALEGKPDLI